LNQPLVTVALTCFNAEDTIERAVRTALAQDWTNKEVLIVDDGSKDRSWEILTKLAAAEPAVQILRTPKNLGAGGARNFLLRAAKGEFVAFVDDDDEVRADRVSLQYERLIHSEGDRGQGLVFCFSNRKVVSDQNIHIAKGVGWRSPEPDGKEVADHLIGINFDPNKGFGLLGTCTLFARVSDILALGGFDESFRRCQDTELCFRAGTMGAHFVSVDEPLIMQHKTFTSDKAGQIPLQYALKMCHKHKGYLKQQRAYTAALAFAHSRFYGATDQPWKARLFATIGRFFLLFKKGRFSGSVLNAGPGNANHERWDAEQSVESNSLLERG
jgi:GT2 family glycosyltransferase